MMHGRSTRVYLDAERITANMRSSRTGFRATIATSHRPYAISQMGFLIHKVEGVRLDWWAPDRLSNVLAVYRCGDASTYPIFYRRMPAWRHHPYRRPCGRCFR